MDKIRELAKEMALLMDPQAEFLLILRPKEADPQTGRRAGVVATNVGRPDIDDMIVAGTSSFVMDQIFKQRNEQGN